MMEPKWDYEVWSSPEHPPGSDRVIAGSDDIRWWLDTMDRRGWEFVGQAVSWFTTSEGRTPFERWIFRRPHGT